MLFRTLISGAVAITVYCHHQTIINHVSPQLDMMTEQTPDEYICEYESSSCCVVRVWELTVGDGGSVAVSQGVRTVVSTMTRSVQNWDPW